MIVAITIADVAAERIAMPVTVISAAITAATIGVAAVRVSIAIVSRLRLTGNHQSQSDEQDCNAQHSHYLIMFDVFHGYCISHTTTYNRFVKALALFLDRTMLIAVEP